MDVCVILPLSVEIVHHQVDKVAVSVNIKQDTFIINLNHFLINIYICMNLVFFLYLIATKYVFINSLDPYETSSNSASHPKPSFLLFG